MRTEDEAKVVNCHFDLAKEQFEVWHLLEEARDSSWILDAVAVMRQTRSQCISSGA